jgi:hypothetical protein
VRRVDNFLHERVVLLKFLNKLAVNVGLDAEVVGRVVSDLALNRAFLSEEGVDCDDNLVFSTDDLKGIGSGFVGLFWFTPDYGKVVDLCGVREFTKGNRIAKQDLFPVGFHGDKESNPSSRPRGRVSMMRGDIVINVGFRCPDSVLELVAKAFSLRDTDGEDENDKIEIRLVRGMHWDPK